MHFEKYDDEGAPCPDGFVVVAELSKCVDNWLTDLFKHQTEDGLFPKNQAVLDVIGADLAGEDVSLFIYKQIKDRDLSNHEQAFKRLQKALLEKGLFD